MKKDIFKKAHTLTKEIIRKGDNYRATFKLCLSFVYSKFKKGVRKMIELKGSEKQVKWAEDIRLDVNKILDIIKETDMARKTRKNKSFEESSKKIELARDFINSQTQSKFFIDNFKELSYKKDDEKLYTFYEIFKNKDMFESFKINAIIRFAMRELSL